MTLTPGAAYSPKATELCYMQLELIICKISGFHGDKYEDNNNNLLEYSTV
jgi:hypothetical protein